MLLLFAICNNSCVNHNPQNILCYNLLENRNFDRPIYCFYYDNDFHYRSILNGFYLDNTGCMVDTLFYDTLGVIIPLKISSKMTKGVDTIKCGLSYESPYIPDFEIMIEGMKQCSLYLEKSVGGRDIGTYCFELTPSEQCLLGYAVGRVQSKNSIDMTTIGWNSKSPQSKCFEGSYLFLQLITNKIESESFVCYWADSVPWEYYFIGDAIGAIAINHMKQENRISSTIICSDIRDLFDFKLTKFWKKRI